MDFQRGDHRIYTRSEQGKTVAEITFPRVAEGKVDINHTFVDHSLRGQGVADQLVRAAVNELREKDLKCEVSCSYAKQWFEDHPECADLLCAQDRDK